MPRPRSRRSAWKASSSAARSTRERSVSLLVMADLIEATCDLKRVALLYNPVSGTDDPDARRARLEALAEGVGLTCGLTETDRREGAAPLARKALADGVERLLVCGGDGSVTE